VRSEGNSTVTSGLSPEIKEQVRQSIDVVDLVGSYLELRREGRGYKALCPWHNDTKPSLQINPERQTWKCWVCDLGGDVFSFVMQREGVGFREALEMLAERAGIVLHSDPNRPKPQAGSPEDKPTLFQAMAWAEQQFHQCLMHANEAAPARQYLAARSITPESIERFQLGYAPDEWQWLVDRANNSPFSHAVLERVGLLGKSQKSGRPYDRFKGRVLFSIRDTQSRPIALGGRILPGAGENAAKYINSPETPLFSKSNQLYALDLARDTIAKTRRVVVMEGYTDVVIAHQMGVTNAVAVLGTALGERHVTLLRRLADGITLVLDGDEAGQRRTNEILELFIAQQVELKILTLPSGLDPADYLLQHGRESFETLLDGAVDALEHKVRTATAGIDPNADTHRANQALEEILSTMAKAPRLQATTESAIRLRETQILTRLAREFRVPEEDLRSRMTALRKRMRRHVGAPSDEAADPIQPIATDPWECELLEVLLQEPESITEVAATISPETFSPGPCREIYTACCELSQSGQTPTLDRLMNRFERLDLKNLLVKLDEHGREKVGDDSAMRLKALLESFRKRGEARRWQSDTAAIREGELNQQQELDVLQNIVEQKRSHRVK
jgi:DNA primase